MKVTQITYSPPTGWTNIQQGCTKNNLVLAFADRLVFAGDVPTGSYAQLMRANFERLIQGAANAAQIVKNHNDYAVL